MTKHEIYQEIDAFNRQPSIANVKNSKPVLEQYLYVDRTIAEDRASFLKYILANKIIIDSADFKNKVVLDLAFGSGNLTSHLLLDNEIDYQQVIFNDKITTNTHQEIEHIVDKASITSNDFLSFNQWGTTPKVDVLIFNPQMGGGYEDGQSSLEQTKCILSDLPFSAYLLKKDANLASKVKITKEEINKKISVTSEELTKTDLKELLKDISIFNYYDVFYQSKQSKAVGKSSANVKFRHSVDLVFNPSGVLLFYGSRDYFEALFADFYEVAEYWAEDGGNHLFIAKKGLITKPLRKCYEREGNTFKEIPNCKKELSLKKVEGNLDELEEAIEKNLKSLGIKNENSLFSDNIETSVVNQIEAFSFSDTKKGKLDFEYKNILLKGVPGTGKSRLINKSFLIKELQLGINDPNVLRINIHSASSNADLMQGIGITTNSQNQVEYREKQGLILNHLYEAIKHPYQAFAIILEEIQENSLNELIGDLIYLIEADKRTDLKEKLAQKLIDLNYASEEAFFNHLASIDDIHFVEIPQLVSAKTKYRKMVMPANLYFFCTSNYRDDKKVIEDNLLRRFDVIEIYPKNKLLIGKAFKSQEVSDFLEDLNKAILKQFRVSEIHPDRFMVGHAIWLEVANEQSFCRAMLKVVTEFKDVKEIEFNEFKPLLNEVTTFPFFQKKDIIKEGYQEIITFLQSKAYPNILNA